MSLRGRQHRQERKKEDSRERGPNVAALTLTFNEGEIKKREKPTRRKNPEKATFHGALGMTRKSEPLSNHLHHTHPTERARGRRTKARPSPGEKG